MTFPNAYRGVKKLFLAEIFTIVAGFVFFASTLVTAIVTNNPEATTEDLVKNIGYVIPVLCAGVLTLVAAVINIIGLVQASKDEAYFSFALFAVIAGVVVTILRTVLSNWSAFADGTLVYTVLETLGSVFEILVTIFVVYGVIMLSGRLGKISGVFAGKRVLNIIVAVYVLIFIMKVLEMIFGKGSAVTQIESILSIVVSVLSITGYVLYLILLGQATKMLKNN